jgi:hypothetical protein
MPIHLRPIAAVAVADEPEPFWDGDNEDDRFQKWHESIAWNPAWGKVLPARLNGFSGAWLRDNLMKPLGLHRSAT